MLEGRIFGDGSFLFRAVMIIDKPKRKLQRLINYDYSQNGAYFVTICMQNRLPLFGKIENGKLILNKTGKMIFDKLAEIPRFYHNIKIDKFIVMPNHIHGILVIQHDGTAQGRSLQ